MRAAHALRRNICLFIILCIAVCPFVLAACGANNAAAGSTSTPSPTTPSPTRAATTGSASAPSPTPTAGSVRGYGAAYGCPSDVVVSAAPAVANITIRPGKGQTTFNAHRGNVIEVQLPLGMAWKGPLTISGPALQPLSPAGYVWKPANACIWHFVARNAGTTTFAFSGMALCKKTILCTPSEVIDQFTINVM